MYADKDSRGLISVFEMDRPEWSALRGACHDLSYKDSERFMLVIREAIFSRIACNDILIVIMILPYSQ